MSELSPSKFSTYTLTLMEDIQGKILTTLNKQVLQNMRAEVATEILSAELPVSQEGIEKYRNFLLHAQAKIVVIDEILAGSDAAEAAIEQQREEMRQQSSPTAGNIYDAFRSN